MQLTHDMLGLCLILLHTLVYDKIYPGIIDVCRPNEQQIIFFEN